VRTPLGELIHITELGVPSTSAHARNPRTQKLWHGAEWTPAIQADWVKQFYTLCFSKMQIEAITWWDLADPAFTRDGGLLDEKFQPKEAYTRLKTLVDSWKA
jgi:endo-1,4-beta-xylanase